MTTSIETLLPWSEPKEVNTSRGQRRLRIAPATQTFWAAWKTSKADLQAAGVGCSKNRCGEWEACWWLPISSEAAAKTNEAVAASRATDAAIDIPAPDGLAYLPFQRAGIKFLSERDSTLLADDMGLGKTVQAIGLINLDPSIRKVLVVCPASLKVNWRNELKRWLSRPLSVAVQEAGAGWVGNHVDVTVLNYDILGKFPEIFTTEWDLLVADEAHYVKNRKAKRTKLLLGAVKESDRVECPGIKAKRRVFMTGTPVLNKPIELFPLLESLQPGKWTFKDKIRYCDGHKGRWGWDFTGAAHLDELQTRLRSTLMCRRLKKEVLTELPPKRRQVVEISANGDSELVAEEGRQFAAHERKLTALKARAEVARLADDEAEYKRVVDELNGAYMVAFTEIAKMRHAVAVAKVPKVVEHAMNVLEDTRKLVVFTHHHDVSDAIAAGLSEHGVLMIDGRTANEDRQPIVDQFNSGDKRVLVLGIRAAGVGLSVKASVELFAELDWTPGNMAQAEDRCHGVGRGIEGEPLLVQHLVLEDSLDCRMAKALVAKQDIADLALDKGAAMTVGSEPVLTIEVGSVIEEAKKTVESSGKQELTITEALREHVHAGLRQLAACDTDWATAQNGVGFNKLDGAFGHSLAERAFLTDKMIPYAMKLCTKYRRQLGDSFTAKLKELQ